MNRLLRKFLFEISTLPTRITEAMPTPKPTEENPETGLPAGLYQRGSAYYSNPRGGRENYVGKIIDGKFVYAQDKLPSSPTGTREPSASGDADQAKDDGSVASAFKDTFKSKVHMLSPLVDAINSGDAGEIRAQMEQLGIVRDADGKLKSTMKGVGYGFFGKSEEALRATKELEAVLAQHDITIPDERELEISTTSAEALKPQNIKKGTKKAEIKAIRDKNGKVSGFEASGRTYGMIPRAPNLVTRLVESSKPLSIVEVFKARGMGDDEARAEAEAVDTAIASHNTKITLLANEAEKTKDAFVEVTDRTMLAQSLVDRVIESAGNNLSDEQRSVISDMLIRLSKADTTEEFDAEWSGDFSAFRQRGTQRTSGDREILLQLLMRAGLRPNAIPALCESVEVLRKSTGNATVLIPRRHNFELVDIVVLRDPVKTGLESIEDIDRLNDDIVQQLQLVNVSVELLGVKSGGTKGSGRASASQTRVLLTEFDGGQTKRDLISFVGTEALSGLWNCSDETQLATYTEERFTALAPYMDDIISYYGLTQRVEGKDEKEVRRIVMATLSNGTFPQYDREGNFSGVGPEASLFSTPGITELNRLQMRLYSFLGYAADAIYNMRARRQGFTNTTYTTSGITETNGKTQMARSVFQFGRSPIVTENESGGIAVRPSYSYTSHLEHTESERDMQTFAARRRRGAVNEGLLTEEREKISNATKNSVAGLPPDATYRSGQYIYNAATGGKYLGRISNDKFIASKEDTARVKQLTAPTEPPEPSKSKKAKSKQSKAKQPKTVQPTPETVRSLNARAREKLRVGFTENLRALGEAKTKKEKVAAIEAMKKFITDNDIILGNSGRLKAVGLAGSNDLFSTDRLENSEIVRAYLETLGITFSGRSRGQLEAERLKPQRIFIQEELSQLSLKETETGIEVEGVVLDRVDENDVAQSWVEAVNAGRAKKGLPALNKTTDADTIKKIQRFATRRARARNHVISQLTKTYKDNPNLQTIEFPRKNERGETESVEESLRHISATMKTALFAEGSSVPEDKRANIEAALDKMGTAKNLADFDAAYKELAMAGSGTIVEVGMKNLAETLQVMRVLRMGGRAILPLKEDFKLMDVIAVTNDPILGVPTALLYLVDGTEPTVDDADDLADLAAAHSVKTGLGAASSNLGKIENSTFIAVPSKDAEGNAVEISGDDVRKDLAEMSEVGIKNSIFDENTDKLTDEAKNQITGYIQKYGNIIRKYYGLPENMSDEEVYKLLSYGKTLGCVDGKTQSTTTGPPHVRFSEGSPPTKNAEQWQAWSVAGKVMEAVHNSTVDQQFYVTTVYTADGRIIQADGNRSRSKMIVPAVKSKMKKGKKKAVAEAKRKPKRKKTSVQEKPETRQVGFTVPVTSEEELRSGNPCRGQQ